MGTYKLTPDAEDDLYRIWLRGVREYGEAQADKYYFAFFDRFEQFAEQPYLYQAVDHIRARYRHSVCGVDTIYYRVEADTVEIMPSFYSQGLFFLKVFHKNSAIFVII